MNVKLNKSTFSIILLLTISIGVNAQTLKEKIAAKKAAFELSLNNKLLGEVTTLDPNVSQAEIASKWEDGTYDIYDFNGEACNQNGSKTTFTFTKVDGKVISVKQDDGGYVADEEGKSEFIRYFKSNGGWNIVFTDNWAYIFTGKGDNMRGQKFIKKTGRYADAQMVKKYLEDSKVNQEAELANYAKNQSALKNKADAERKAKWSIEGKNVTKIEVTDIKAPYSFGYYRPFSFQIKATLANGKTISTSDGGFWSDYTITYKNGDIKSKTIQDTKFITGDKILVEVKSKFDGSIKATGDVVMNYSETLTLNNNSNNWGESALNYRIEVKQRTHAVTGKQVIMIKSIDLSGYAKPKYMIIDADQSLNIYTNGHDGYKTVGTGNATGPGANAGNGGNITVIKDPSVTSFNINYTLNGGTGGAGTYGYNRGRDGRDGTYKEEVRKVNF